MARYLKRGMDAGAIKAADAKVRETVEAILADIEARGDAAVRELSQKFDNWSPASFRLTRAGDRARDRRRSRKRDLDDIRFAQAQVRNFAAEAEGDACATSRSRRCPASILGHRNIPVNSVGCYVPGGRYPMVASAHMSVVTARVAGVKRIIACAPPFQGGPHPAIVAAMHLGGADEIYVLGGVQAVGAMALGTETIAPGRHARRPRQRLCRRGQAPALRPRRHRPASPARPRRWSSPTTASTREICATDLLGQAEHGPTSPAVLLTTSEKLARDTMAEVERLLTILPTADARRQGLGDYGEVIVCDDDDEMVARGRPHRLRARAGDDARSGLFPRQHDELRRAVPRPAHQRRLRRQGDRHQPHAADQEGGALHRRAVGRQVPQDLHLPEGADRRGVAP